MARAGAQAAAETPARLDARLVTGADNGYAFIQIARPRRSQKKMFGATCDALARRGLTSEICGRDAQMTYVVNDSCIRCKTTDCVAVCPVDCFYEGENMLVIHPDECIDCGVCEPECPVDAIKAESEPGLEKWLSLNA